jgi:NAD+ kinase
MSFTNIAIVGKRNTPSINSYIINLANYLTSNNLNIYIEYDCLEEWFYHKKCRIGKLSDFIKDIDLVIVIGGDGTLLGVAREVVAYNIPIIGINQGKLGFMTDIPANQMIEEIESIVKENKFACENRSLIQAEVIRDDKLIYQSLALNDIVISRGAIGSMIDFDISIDGQFVLSQKSDGVIFSTSTGSTAYSLAAGGPILHPQLHAISIVPICPQSLSNRPIVVSDNSTIELILVKDNQTQIHFDGQHYFQLSSDDKIILKKYDISLRLLHTSGYNYYRTLRKKLDWSKRVS